MQRRQNPDAEPLEFEKKFGFKEIDTLTRVELQYGGDRIPAEFETFGSLHRAPDYNPYQNIGRSELPIPEECEGLEYFIGIGLHNKSNELGMQEFRKLLNRQTKGNAARTMQSYQAFFPSEFGKHISTAKIFEIRHVQRGQQTAQPRSMFGLDASLRAAFGKLLQSLVPKALDHSYSV